MQEIIKPKDFQFGMERNMVVELYNHSNNTIDENDMNTYDNYNLAYDNNMQDIVHKLHKELMISWDNQTWAINYKHKNL